MKSLRVIKRCAIDSKAYPPGSTIAVHDDDLAGRLVAAGFCVDAASVPAVEYEEATEDGPEESAVTSKKKRKR